MRMMYADGVHGVAPSASAIANPASDASYPFALSHTPGIPLCCAGSALILLQKLLGKIDNNTAWAQETWTAV